MSASSGAASGKVIFFGEHAVVYGVPGLAAGIARGARAEATPTSSGNTTLLLGETLVSRDDATDLARSLRALCDHADPLPPLDLRASAEIPPGGGLGCSAALGVSIARAALLAAGRAASDDEVFDRAMAWERVYHGNPSGIDTAAALHGGFLRFERGARPREVAAPVDVWIAVGYSGSSASTKVMVEGVAALEGTNPNLHARFLDGVRGLVARAEEALLAADERAFGALMRENQALLREVGLSTPAIDAMAALAEGAEALGVKLTGSGGGGSVIALGGFARRGEASSPAEARADAVARAWSGAGYAAFPTKIRGSEAPHREIQA